MSETDLSVLEKLFDTENDENVFLFDENGKEIELEQIAAINHDGEVYAVLHPIEAAEEEVLVFRVETEDEESLVMIDDEKLIDKILAKAVSGN